MTDKPPVQQDPPVETPPVQQEDQNPGVDYEARYKGSVSKIQELTLSNRQLQSQLETLTSDKEQLSSQLGIKDVEKDTALGERDKKIQELLQAQSVTDTELASLKALQLKLKVINDLNQPELIKIVDKIPNLTDEEALTTVMKDFASWGADLVKQREQQLMAGFTPNVAPNNVSTAPSSHSSWQDHINSLTHGSDERNKAMTQYWEWGQENPIP